MEHSGRDAHRRLGVTTRELSRSSYAHGGSRSGAVRPESRACAGVARGPPGPGTRDHWPGGQRWSGAPGRNRTCDQVLRRHLLYPLSYGGAASCSVYARTRGIGGADAFQRSSHAADIDPAGRPVPTATPARRTHSCHSVQGCTSSTVPSPFPAIPGTKSCRSPRRRCQGGGPRARTGTASRGSRPVPSTALRCPPTSRPWRRCPAIQMASTRTCPCAPLHTLGGTPQRSGVLEGGCFLRQATRGAAKANATRTLVTLGSCGAVGRPTNLKGHRSMWPAAG
jgi:hypothetical protein